MSFKSVMNEAYVRSISEGVHPISFATGRFLYLVTFVVATNKGSANVLEVGTGYGFSTLWLAKALVDSDADGRVYSVEIREDRVEGAKAYLKRAGLNDFVEILLGDAKDVIPRLNVTFDVVFIDGKKEEYFDYLMAVEPKLKMGGLLIAHNVMAPSPHKLQRFFKEVLEGEKWATVILPIDYGLSLSVKVDRKS